ncbi:MAG: NYN domain-containing protein [Chloroflexi bacterium]|nr:NYN domain-containing protein [Chloroflexota bacterium]
MPVGSGGFVRTNVYVDAFNLYYGALRRTPHLWLDLRMLSELLLPRDEVVRIRYFTALIQPRLGDPQAPQRQQAYLRALATIPGVSIHLGSFMAKTKIRPRVDGQGFVQVHDTEEKGSDVNLASFLLHDGHRGEYEQAVVISNDSDLRTPIEMVRQDLGLPVGLLNPYRRVAFGLAGVAIFYKPIRSGVLGASQLPSEITDEQGAIHKPATW